MPDRHDSPAAPPIARRLFVGLELPDEIRHALARLDHGVDEVRWVREELLHVTLAFLGDVDAGREARLARHSSRCTYLRSPSGSWVWARSAARARASCGQGSSMAIHTCCACTSKSRRPCNAPDSIRIRSLPSARHDWPDAHRDTPRARPFLQRYGETEFGTWTVSSVALFRSVLSARGPAYTMELRREF